MARAARHRLGIPEGTAGGRFGVHQVSGSPLVPALGDQSPQRLTPYGAQLRPVTDVVKKIKLQNKVLAGELLR